jgi:hypothetical protein
MRCASISKRKLRLMIGYKKNAVVGREGVLGIIQDDIKNVKQIECFLVRASSYIRISRPRDATCDRFLFSIYMCITLRGTCFERQALIIRSPSPYIQPSVSVFVSVCGTVL